MELYQKQQFDFLLMTSAERFAERIVQRCAGQDNALEKIKADRNAEGVWLDQFVEALFEDFLLDNTAGAVFILSALEKRDIEFTGGGKIGQVLQTMAKQAFGELLHIKTIESLEQSIGVGA
jgi:hypothetical protein